MEALVQEKILSSFVNEVSVESETIKPINVDIKTINIIFDEPVIGGA